MTEQDERIKECFLDMLNQACGEWKHDFDAEKRLYVGAARFQGFDSRCLSAYEGALSLAVELGWIKKEDVLR